MNSKRNNPIRSGDYLISLNDRLSGLDDLLFPDPPKSQNVFIVGAPRSGTTLVSQVMAAVFDIGYINNVAAAFWEAPATGVLHGHRFAAEPTFVGNSSYGQTAHPSEPHEFGGFWRSQLAYDDMAQKADHTVQWERLSVALDRVGAAWQKPVFYKVFHLAWHLAEFDAIRSDSKWIWIQRDLPGNARSLMKLAAERGERWTSAVPLAAIERFNDAEDWQRATAQIVLFNEWVQHQLTTVDDRRILRLELETLIREPQIQIEKIGHFLGTSIDRGMSSKVADALKPQGRQDAEFSAAVNSFAERLL